jgi:hypothetical protein
LQYFIKSQNSWGSYLGLKNVKPPFWLQTVLFVFVFVRIVFFFVHLKVLNFVCPLRVYFRSNFSFLIFVWNICAWGPTFKVHSFSWLFLRYDILESKTSWFIWSIIHLKFTFSGVASNLKHKSYSLKPNIILTYDRTHMFSIVEWRLFTLYKKIFRLKA